MDTPEKQSGSELQTHTLQPAQSIAVAPVMVASLTPQIQIPSYVDTTLPSQLTPIQEPDRTAAIMKPPVDSKIVVPSPGQPGLPPTGQPQPGQPGEPPLGQPTPQPQPVGVPPTGETKAVPAAKQKAPVDIPFNTKLFADRIYTKDWSHFAGEDYVMVNPKELLPENEPRLTAKLLKHYSVAEPAFFDYQPRMGIAVALASFVPMPLSTRKEQAMKELTDIYLEAKTGKHPEDLKLFSRYNKPFAAHIKLWRDPKEQDLLFDSLGKTAMTLYLIVNEALKDRGREIEAAGYMTNPSSPDHALALLAPKLGVTAQQLSAALMNGGVDGLAKLLNVKPQAVEEIKQVSEYAGKLDFANNVVANWNMGRAIEGMQTRTVEEKIKVGLMVRTAHKLKSLQGMEYPAIKPKDIQIVEARVLARLAQLPQELQEALYYTGTEIALTSNRTVDDIFGFPVPALGLHNHVPFIRGEAGGIRQIYVGSRDVPPNSDNTLVHEAHHLLFPKSFSEKDIGEMETLVAQNSQRMTALERCLAAWEIAQPEQQRLIEAEMNKLFTVGDVTLEKALGGKITGAGMRALRNFVYDAHQNLNPHSEQLARGYPSIELRTTELISRYSELRYVRAEARPEMLQFVAPEMGVVYDNYYLKHVREELVRMKEGQSHYPAHMQYLGFPGDMKPVIGTQPVQPAKIEEKKKPATELPLTIQQAAKLHLVERPTKMVAAPSTEHIEASKATGRMTEAFEKSFAKRLEAVETSASEPAR